MLPRYSGPWTQCPKCANLEAEVKYYPDTGHGTEYFLRTCTLCGYSWEEACLDLDKESKPKTKERS